MNLQTRCLSCGDFIRFKSRAVDRFDLARKIGNEAELTCISCNTTSKYDLNDIKARPNKWTGLLAALVLIGGTLITLFFVLDWSIRLSDPHAIGAIAGLIVIPSLFYSAINHQQQQKVNYFNAKQYG